MIQQTHLSDADLNILLKMFDSLNRKYQPKMKIQKQAYYERAKQLQTKDRNLKQALRYYALSAMNGQKIQSSIKDFASVLHQCGRTYEAVLFLQKYKQYSKGQKYLNLLQNLRKQIVPSGKFLCKKILLVNIPSELTEQQIKRMFENHSRIQQVILTSSLDFKPYVHQTYYYKNALVLFESFSAAKKTLQTFRYSQWFGIDKYWTNLYDLVICEAKDGRTDFDKITMKHELSEHIIYSEVIIPQMLIQKIPKKIIKRVRQVVLTKSRQDANNHSISIIKETMSYIDKIH